MRKKILLPESIESASSGDMEDIIIIERDGSPHPWKRSFFEKELVNELSFFKIYRNYENCEIEGFLIFRLVEDIVEIINISVRERSRGKGVATELMLFLMGVAERESVSAVFLEVRESNIRAIKFYKKFKFKKIGVRKNYYKSPVEDALVFSLKF